MGKPSLLTVFEGFKCLQKRLVSDYIAFLSFKVTYSIKSRLIGQIGYAKLAGVSKDKCTLSKQFSSTFTFFIRACRYFKPWNRQLDMFLMFDFHFLQTVMMMHIPTVQQRHFGTYACKAKNPRGHTDGIITLSGKH